MSVLSVTSVHLYVPTKLVDLPCSSSINCIVFSLVPKILPDNCFSAAFPICHCCNVQVELCLFYTGFAM